MIVDLIIKKLLEEIAALELQLKNEPSEIIKGQIYYLKVAIAHLKELQQKQRRQQLDENEGIK